MLPADPARERPGLPARGAEGATSPEPLRPTDRTGQGTLESRRECAPRRRGKAPGAAAPTAAAGRPKLSGPDDRGGARQRLRARSDATRRLRVTPEHMPPDLGGFATPHIGGFATRH